jgi:AraC-like DNA-binding protein
MVEALTAPAVPALATHQSDSHQGLARAVETMHEKPADSHTVSRLAKLAGMSRSNFAESFRLCFGRSPMEFLRATRMDHAANLLRESTLPIKLVGASAGYGSRTSFAHAFRRAFTMSPADYRSSHAKPSPTDIHAVSERLRTQRGASQDLAWEVDLTSGSVWWSEGTFRALGYDTRKKLISDVARFYERIHPDDRERVTASMSTACGGNRLTWEAAFGFRKADGTYVRIANGCVILRSSGGAAVRLIGVMQVLETSLA